MQTSKNDSVVINFDASEEELNHIIEYFSDIRDRGFLDDPSISITQNVVTGHLSFNAYTNHSYDLNLTKC